MESDEMTSLNQDNIPNVELLKPLTYFKGAGIRMGISYGWRLVSLLLVITVIRVLLERFLASVHPSLVLLSAIPYLAVVLFLPYFSAGWAVKALHSVKIKFGIWGMFGRQILWNLILIVLTFLIVGGIAMLMGLSGINPRNSAFAMTVSAIFLIAALVWPIFGGGWVVYSHLHALKAKGKLKIEPYTPKALKRESSISDLMDGDDLKK